MKKLAVLISYYDVWYVNRLEYVDKYLRNKGYETLILMGDFNHYSKTRIETYSNIEHIKYISVVGYQKNISIARLYSHWVFANQISKQISILKPDFVYCVVPPNSPIKTIVSNKKGCSFKLVFDVVDLWPESMPGVNMSFLPFQMWKALRDRNINEADLVVLECGLYADKLNAVIRKDKMHIWHLVRKPLSKTISCEGICDDGVIRLAYLGSINHLIDIELISKIVKALIKLRPVEVRIVGKGEKTKEFEEALTLAGAKVIYYGAVYDEDRKREIFHDCHLGLNVYKTTNTIGLTIKSVEYMQYGLPLINTIGGDTENFISEYGIGVTMKPSHAIDVNMLEKIYINNIDYRRRTLCVFDCKFSVDTVNDKLAMLDDIVGCT